MSLMSAKKLLMANGIRAADPFTLSGGWQSGNEGWSFSNMQRNNAGIYARTGGWAILKTPNPTGTATISLPKEMVRKLNINVSVWHSGREGSYHQAAILFSFGTNPFTEISVQESPLNLYSQISGLIANAPNENLRIRLRSTVISGAAYHYFDDWIIQGVKP